MDRVVKEERLFKNKFVTNFEEEDLPSSKKEEFKRYHESRKEKSDRRKVLDKASVPVKEPSTNIYEDLAVFSTSKTVKMNAKKMESVKIEKRTIVSVDSRYRDTNKYPKQNDFIAFLGKTFFNVKKIEMISSEIPNVDQTIKELPIELKNNTISWQNEEDIDLNFFENLMIATVVPNTVYITLPAHGFTSSVEAIIFNSKLDTDLVFTGLIDGKKLLYVVDSNTLGFDYINGILAQGTTSIDLGYPIYHVDVKPGNYTAQTLADKIAEDSGLIKRRNGTGQFHFFEVKVNFDTDVLFLDSVVTTQLPSNSVSTIAGSTTITINQNGHGFKTGDRVKMIGVKTVAGVPGAILNGDYIVNVLDFNTFTYEVITRASETTDGGGNTVRTGKDAPFRLLFDTQDTRIQFNTGFPNEDSSEPVNAINPITTKALSLSNAQILNNTTVRFTTPTPHNLDAVTILNISSIATGQNPVVTTITPHLIDIPRRVTLRNTNCIPEIKGTFFAIPNGRFTFRLRGLFVTTSGNTGQAIYGKDKIKIIGLQTVPSILIDPVYFVENIPSPTQFDITFSASGIDLATIPVAIIGTSQLTVKHIAHGFNQLSSIVSVDSQFVNIKTFLPNMSLIGTRTTGVSIIDGPVGTNTIDVLLFNHSLVTSDIITIRNSTTVPVIDGRYTVQVIDLDTLRLNFVHVSFVDGTATVLSGDSITLSYTNSLPKVDGTYHIHNRQTITNITTGVITSNITTSSVHNWSVGDTITITGSDCIPSLDGQHTIQAIVNSTTFSVNLTAFDITTPGTTGSVVNNTVFKIQTNFLITTSGMNPAGIVGRNNNVLHYRVEPEIPAGDNIGGIPLSIINGVSKTIDRLIDVDTYLVRATEEYASKSISSGGSLVKASSQRHGLRSIQANTDTGGVNGKLFRSISLEGQNYVYLVADSGGTDLATVLNTANISNTFAKIVLNESPGNMMFNSFISEAKVFENPIAKIDTLRFKVLTAGGFQFDFNDIDYSFTLRMTELVDQVKDSGVSSRTGGNEFEGLRDNNDDDSKDTKKDTDSSGLKTGTLGASFNAAGAVRSGSGRQ